MNDADEKQRWLDQPKNVDKIVYGLYAVCVLLVLCDLFYEKHTYYSYEHVFGFHGVYGFVACVALVLAAKGLRLILKRREDYYDR